MRSLPVLIASFLAWILVACAGPAYTLNPDPTPYLYTSPIEYYLYLSQSYTSDREWPVFVGIHGFGGDGRDCLELWQAYADQAGFILVCPSLADERGGWYVDQGEWMVKDILRHVRAECHTKPRIFLAGFSAGAEFVQAFAFDNPDQVAAVAVLSSGNYLEPSLSADAIPFLVVIGDQDDPVGLKNATGFTDLLEQNGFSVNLHILPGVGHEITQQTKDLTMELFQQVFNP